MDTDKHGFKLTIKKLQRCFMLPLAAAIWMTLATVACQRQKAGKARSTILTRVLLFLTALIQSVFSFTRAAWVTLTAIASQGGNTGKRRSAIFAVVIHSSVCLVHYQSSQSVE
jgi:hypothetical protein